MNEPTEPNPALRLVLIEWIDSFGCARDWSRLDFPFEAPAVMVCRSVGWLAHDGDESKLVIPHLADKDEKGLPKQGMGDITIPTCAIRRIVDLDERAEATPTRADGAEKE